MVSHISELNFFTNTPTDWNYNILVDNPSTDPYTNRPFKSMSYNGMKYNVVIMLKEILKNSNNIFNEDVHEYINKKCMQGSKTDFYDLLSITSHLFHYVLNCNESTNLKSLRKWFKKNPFIYDSFSEKTLEQFDGNDLYEMQRSKEKADSDTTYNNLFNKCIKIYINSDDENDRIISRNYLIILEFLKKRIYYRSALHRFY